MPGATPKVTISASESSCLPNSLLTCNFRARKPSKKSKNAPAKIANGAMSILPVTARSIAIHPDNKFAAVNRLGILNIDCLEKIK